MTFSVGFMKKRFLTVLALFVIVPTMIFATGVAISWEWMIDDPQVTGFRYQLDDENSDNWIVVDGDTTSAVFQNLDGSAEYSLYLQQTFDGVNWSDSAISVAYPLFDAEPVVADVIEEAPVEDAMVSPMEEAPMVESVVEAPMEEAIVEAPMEEAIVEAPMEEAPMEEAPMEEAPMEDPIVEVPMENTNSSESRYFTSIGLNVGVAYNLANIGTYEKLQPILGMSLGFNNIKTFNNYVGLGLDLDINTFGYMKSGSKIYEELLNFYQDNTKFSFKITLVPEIEFNFGKFGMDLGLVGGVSLVNVPYVGEAVIPPTFDQLNYVVFTYGLKTSFDYHFTDLISLGLDVAATKINDLSITNSDYSIDSTLSLRLNF